MPKLPSSAAEPIIPEPSTVSNVPDPTGVPQETTGNQGMPGADIGPLYDCDMESQRQSGPRIQGQGERETLCRDEEVEKGERGQEKREEREKRDKRERREGRGRKE